MQAILSLETTIEKPDWRQMSVTERIDIPLPFQKIDIAEPSPQKTLALFDLILEQELVWAGWKNQNSKAFFKRFEFEFLQQDKVHQEVILSCYLNLNGGECLDVSNIKKYSDAFMELLQNIFEKFNENSVLIGRSYFDEKKALYTTSFQFSASARLNSPLHKGYLCQTWVHASMKAINEFMHLQIPEIDSSIGFISFKKLFLEDVLCNTFDYFKNQAESINYLVNFIAYHEMLSLKREFKDQLPLYKRRGFVFTTGKTKGSDGNRHGEGEVNKADESVQLTKVKQQPLYYPSNSIRKRNEISPVSNEPASKDMDISSPKLSFGLYKKIKI